MKIIIHKQRNEIRQVNFNLTNPEVKVINTESKGLITEQILIQGESKDVLAEINDNSIDFMATDPAYELSFTGKYWDKALPEKQIWTECYRVLKPGAYIAVMSSPRSDEMYRMIKDLEDAGFDMSFSPIYFTYHTVFPKASDTSKMIDRRFGAEREVVDTKKQNGKKFKNLPIEKTDSRWYEQGFNKSGISEFSITTPSTELAKKYEGSKLGFQPKPAVEHIIIGMKPHGSKSYIDNVLNFEVLPDNIKMTFPFIQAPKPSKKEKDFGLTGEEKKKPTTLKNIHPTTKPVKLMSYIITLFTREGDWVIDPFLGSGTTGIASKLLNRNFIGVEREKEYFGICEERLSVDRVELIKFFKK
jgi:site-specific DNA-methyltransferase (adenine-specific)